jgi:tetratricopeptide (TPR) repeat protein
VLAGLTWDGVIWSFSTLEAAFWHPLTWLSLMADSELYGMNAGGYHWTNVLLHLANTLLLFLVLSRMTGAVWRSGFVAALFALHPLHVESVAWVAQRKDVLSGFFWMLAMGSYALYAERPGTDRYLLVLLLLILGLMSKPMLVTLPFVFLLLDYWPLGRFRGSWQGLVLEKIPMIIAALCISFFALKAEKGFGAVANLADLPFSLRLSNVVVSYGLYLVKTVWPFHLAVFYPHPGVWPVWSVLGSGVFLLAVSLAVVYWLRKYPYLGVGWFWYLGVLVPVIGLIQVGSHSMADRYTYLSLIGIFVMAVWGIAELAARLKLRADIMAVFGAVLLILLTVAAHFQVQTWRDSETLFEHALKNTKSNYFIHGSLGMVALEEGRYGKAMDHFLLALQIKPNYEPGYEGMAVIFQKEGHYQRAVQYYQQAIEINPGYVEAHYRLAELLVKLGKPNDAVLQCKAILKYKSADPAIYNQLGVYLAAAKRETESEAAFREVVRMNPHHAGYRNNFALVLARENKTSEAIEQLEEAVKLQPSYAAAHYHLAELLDKVGKRDEAGRHYDIAAAINANFKTLKRPQKENRP